MTITALPALNRTDATFKADVDTFFGTELPQFSVEAEAARVEINANTATASAAAVTATTQADLATTNGANQVTLASQWATVVTGLVASTDYSAKAWAIGGTGVNDTAGRGSAKDWATKLTTVDGTLFGARKYANDSASSALTSATEASASASSAAAALASKNSAEAALDAFDDKYLGAKSSDPALDNDGNPLQDGAFYINTVSGYIRVYITGTGWVQGISGVSGVSSINSLTGSINLKTINGESVVGIGDISAQLPPTLVMLSGII